jgi:hypothetical protein
MAAFSTVASITGNGSVFAVAENGARRLLKVGDELQKGETIQTTGDARVELMMEDGQLLAVAPNQTILLDANVADTEARPTAQDSAITAPAAAADTVIEALDRGGDLNTQLDATAAGLTGGAGADGGSTFVQLLRITEGTDPLAFNYNYSAQDPLQQDQVAPQALETTMTLSADPAVDEGSAGVTYTVTLADNALSDMTITLSNGAVIVIPAGSNTGSVLVPVQGDDVYKDGETLQATVETVQGGGFTSITVNDQNVVTVVNDTIDTTDVVVGVSVVGGGETDNVIEGSEVTFRFSVNSAPQTDLVLNVTIGGSTQTITIAAGTLFKDVTVDTRSDENYTQGETTVTGTVNSVSLTDDGNFEKVSIEGASATATVVDDSDVTTITIGNVEYLEGTTNATVTATISNAPTSDLTVTLSNGATITFVANSTEPATSSVFTVPVTTHGEPGSATDASTTVTLTGEVTTGGSEFEAISIVDGNLTINDTTPTVEVTVTSFNVDNDGSVSGGGVLTYGGGNGDLTVDLVVQINGVDYNATDNGDGTWSLDDGQSVDYSEGASYGITADATVTDADGDKAMDDASGGDYTPTATGAIAVQLDDDALTGGGSPGAGDDADGTNVSGYVGFNFGADGAGKVEWLTSVTTSGGATGFTYEKSGDDLLIKQNGTTVLTVTMDTVTGQYTVTQDAPINHASGGDENNQTFTLTYQVTDSDLDKATNTLTINVDDDMVVANVNDAFISNEAHDFTGNLAIMGADTGGSAGVVWTTNLSDLNNLDLTSNGYALVFTYEENSTVLKATANGNTVLTVTANVDGTYNYVSSQPIDLSSLDLADASVSAGGGPKSTYYWYGDGTLSNVADINKDEVVRITGFKNGVESDINPSSTGLGVQNGNFDAGESLHFQFDTTGSDGSVNDAYSVRFELFNYQAGNDTFSIEATYKDGDGFSTESSPGDHWSIETIAGKTYLVITADQGEYFDTLDVSMDTGSVKFSGLNTYTLDDAPPVTLDLTFQATDADGDSVSSSISLTIQNQNTFDGENGENDILIGGSGDDILFGGTGADVFKWELGDQGQAGSQAVDHITDFSRADGDVINLADLLPEVANIGNIGNYLTFSDDGGKAVLTVNVDASGGAEQKIVFDNMTLTQLESAFSASTGDGGADLIQKMIDDHKLVI